MDCSELSLRIWYSLTQQMENINISLLWDNIIVMVTRVENIFDANWEGSDIYPSGNHLHMVALSKFLLAADKMYFLKQYKRSNHEDYKAIVISAFAVTQKRNSRAYTCNNMHHLYTTCHQFIFSQLSCQVQSLKNKHQPSSQSTICYASLLCV